MILPSFLLPGHISADYFEFWFCRFVEDLYPTFKMEQRKMGNYRQYRLSHANSATTIIDVAVLLRPSGRFEIRMARLRSARLSDFQLKVEAHVGPWVSYDEVAELYPHEFIVAGEIYYEFCTSFYVQIARDFDIDFGPRLGYPEGVVTAVALACLAQSQVECDWFLELGNDYSADDITDDSAEQVDIFEAHENVNLGDETILQDEDQAEDNEEELPHIESATALGKEYVDAYNEDDGPPPYFQPANYHPPTWGLLQVRQTFSLGIQPPAKRNDDPWVMPSIVNEALDQPAQNAPSQSVAEPAADYVLDLVLTAWYEQMTRYYEREEDSFMTIEQWARKNGRNERDILDYKGHFDNSHPEYKQKMDAAKVKPKQAPRETTQKRFNLEKDIKDRHPTWSYSRVAQEINKKPGYEDVTEDTIRNDYRAMKVKWLRADRIR